jgi:PAS domain S-box-containing protein
METNRPDDQSQAPLGELPTDVLWKMSLDGTIDYVSSEVMKVRGISAEDAKAQMLEQILTPESAEATMNYLLGLAAAVEQDADLPTFHGTMIYLRADGTTYPCEVRAIPRIGEDGEVEILGISRGLVLDTE